MDRLLSLGVDVHARTGSRGNSFNALELICTHGHSQSSVRILEKILQRTDKARIDDLHRYETGEELVGLLHLHGSAKSRLFSPRTPAFEFCLPARWNRVNPRLPGSVVYLLETGAFSRFRRPSKTRRVTLLRSLLDEGCNPNTLSQPGNRSPLLIHIMAGNLDSARVLLRRGGAVSLSTSDAYGWTPVSWACAYGWTSFLEEMVTMAGNQRLWDFEVTVCLTCWDYGTSSYNYTQAKALHIATIGSAETIAYLLNQEYAIDLDITISDGTTALHIATLLGQHDSITLLVSRGANIDAQDHHGFSALHMSIHHHNESVTALLLKLGAKHLKSKNGKTPLDITAFRSKNIMRMVQDSILGAAATGEGMTAQERHMQATVWAGSMKHAIDRDDEEDVEKLLDGGCSPNIIMRSCRTCTPLLYALGKNNVSERCVSVLISRGASFKGMACRRHGNGRRYNAVTWQGWQRGSKINDGSGSGSSSTSDSSSSSSEDSNSDDQAWPISGFTTLGFFMEGGRPEETLLTYLEAIPPAELIWLVNNSTPAHRAIKRKSSYPLAVLLSHLKRVESSLGRNLAKEVATHSRGDSGNTPLHRATIKKNVPAAKLLIAHGADPDAANSSGMTYLHTAADHDDAAMVEALLDQGASIDVRDCRGRTALQTAVLKDNIHAIEVLLDKGTRVEVNDGGNRFIYLDKIKPFHMLLAASMSINQPGALSVPVWSSALLKVEVATFILNSNFARDIAVDPQTMVLWPSWWQAQVFEKESSRRCLLLFYRRLGPTFFRRLGQFGPKEDTTSKSRNFSLLCFAACHGRVDEVRNLLKMGLDVECEGSASGTALMAAAHEGRAEVVKILVFHSAKIQYKSEKTWTSAVNAAQFFPKIVQWLLVGRFGEQGKLQMPVETSNGSIAGTRPWSGVRQGVFLLEGKFQRSMNHSSIKWLQCLEKVRRMMRGTVAVSELWMPASD